jgi:hypothetical protein
MYSYPYQNRYTELLRVSRQWCHLKMMKWFGFGHESDQQLGPGELALFCAACPQPGINMPSNWMEDPHKWAYMRCKHMLWMEIFMLSISK